MKKNEIVLLCMLFLLAFALRSYDLAYPAFRWGDEIAHVPAATNYWDSGQSEPDNWEHPPLRHLLLYGFLRVFGDNPYGWRLRNVLFGALAVVLTYLFAREISGSKKTALLAGVLLATDPLHVVLSRYTFEEIYGGALFLAAIVLYVKHDRRSSWLALSAFFMGCALATKWYYAPSWLMIWALSLADGKNYRDMRTALFLSSTYLLVPLSVFLVAYYPWFGRGYSAGELVEFIVNAYHSLQGYQPYYYGQKMIFLSHLSPAEWFVRPVIVGQGTYLSADRGEFILYMNDLPIWILTFPALIGMAVAAVRNKMVKIALPVFFFLISYLLLLFVRRPAFIYSSAPLIPFAFTAIAYGISQIADRFGARLYYATFAAVLCWSMYLYPLVTAKKVPVAPYRYILNIADVKII